MIAKKMPKQKKRDVKPLPPIKVTDKQVEFVKDVQETFNPAKSVERVYGYNKEVASKTYGNIMSTAGVRALMNSKGIGITDTHLLDVLKKHLNAKKKIYDKETKTYTSEDDFLTQGKALELAFKLKGYLNPKFDEEVEDKFKQITVNFNLVKARDTDEVKKLLGDMPSITVRDAILRKETVKEAEVVEKKPEPQEAEIFD